MAGFQQVRVSDQVEYTGAGNTKQNVAGNMLEVKKHLSDKFMADTLSTDIWTSTVPGSGDTIAIAETAGGEVVITTGDQDDDSSMLSTAIIFNGSKKAVMEARVSITDVSGTGIFVGFSDAKSESNQSIAIHYPANVLTTVATDAVGFVCDADHSSSLLMACGVYGDTDATAVSTAVTWTDGQTKNLRVELDGTKAWFYVDGIAKAHIPVAVTAATLLCATFQVIVRANDGVNTVKVKRFDAWVDET